MFTPRVHAFVQSIKKAADTLHKSRMRAASRLLIHYLNTTIQILSCPTAFCSVALDNTAVILRLWRRRKCQIGDAVVSLHVVGFPGVAGGPAVREATGAILGEK